MGSPQRVIRLNELVEFTGLRRTQIQELIARGEFPAPIRLSERRIAWLAGDVAAWQADKIAASRCPRSPQPTRSNKPGKESR